MSRVVAVVVTYNRRLLLKECLQALELQTYAINKIIVVDNFSDDGTVEWLKTIDDKRYEIVFMPRNVGGAGGFSKGIFEACKYDCDYVLVLDDDCILYNNYVETLLSYSEKYAVEEKKHQLAALCGIVFENEKIALNHRGYLIKHKHMRIFDFWREFSENAYSAEVLQCDIASFCGLMISKKAISDIGYPQKEYFIKCDDTDYSLRLCKVGTILNVNAAKINHKVKKTNSTNEIDWKAYYDVRNSIDLAKKNKYLMVVLKIIFSSFFKTIAKRNNRTRGIRDWMKAVSDGLCGRLGENEK